MKQPQPDSSVLAIESELWQVQLQPDMGMQTRVCRIQHDQQWLDIMPDCAAADASLSASNFHMLPYSNRIRYGQFTHAGETVQLENAEQHAIHGALRKLPWRVSQHEKHCAAAEFDSRQYGKINWPWPIRATVSYTLHNDSLISDMTLTNCGDQSMPAGMGWHPYFCRRVAGASPQLTIAVSGVYPDTDGDCLPTGAPISVPTSLDFNQARELDPGQRIDHCFSGFHSPATIAWPEAGIALQMHASTACTHLVLFNPDAPYFALEPVTNANDGVNLVGKGIDAGVVIVPAGQTLSAQMTLKLVTKAI